MSFISFMCFYNKFWDEFWQVLEQVSDQVLPGPEEADRAAEQAAPT